MKLENSNLLPGHEGTISLEDAEAKKIAGEALDKMKGGELFIFPFSEFLKQFLRLLKLKKENK